MRVMWGVIGLSALTIILVFAATFAANEASKDSRPDGDGNIVTNGGTVRGPRFGRGRHGA